MFDRGMKERNLWFSKLAPQKAGSKTHCVLSVLISDFLAQCFSTNKTSRSSALMPHRSGWPCKSACCIFQKLLKQLSKFEGLPRQILPILPFPKAPGRNSIALMPSLSRDKPRSVKPTSRCIQIHWSSMIQWYIHAKMPKCFEKGMLNLLRDVHHVCHHLPRHETPEFVSSCAMESLSDRGPRAAMIKAE